MGNRVAAHFLDVVRAPVRIWRGCPCHKTKIGYFDHHRNSPTIISNARRVLAGETFTGASEVGSRIFETHYIPQRDDTGAVVGGVGFTTDVTERHRAAASLQEAEAQFHAVVTNAPSLLFALDQNGVITMIEG